jgi:hypothetical protein
MSENKFKEIIKFCDSSEVFDLINLHLYWSKAKDVYRIDFFIRSKRGRISYMFDPNEAKFLVGGLHYILSRKINDPEIVRVPILTELNDFMVILEKETD